MKQQLLAQALNFYEEAASQELPGLPDNIAAEDRGFGNFVGGLLNGVMVIAALLVFLNLIWGAIEWITSGGDSGKAQKARDKITQSLIGLIVLASTTAIFMAIQTFLGIEIFKFTGDARTTAPHGTSWWWKL